LHDREIKEQDFTETFLRRACGFSMADDKDREWCKATAWRFTNFALVVRIREERRIYKAVKAGKQQPVSRGAPAPKKARRGSKMPSPVTTMASMPPHAPTSPNSLVSDHIGSDGPLLKDNIGSDSPLDYIRSVSPLENDDSDSLHYPLLCIDGA
jgi:hypothetical protein